MFRLHYLDADDDNEDEGNSDEGDDDHDDDHLQVIVHVNRDEVAAVYACDVQTGTVIVRQSPNIDASRMYCIILIPMIANVACVYLYICLTNKITMK